MIARLPKALIFLIVGVTGGVWLALSLARYETFHNHTFDLAFYTRMAWGYAHVDLWDPVVGAVFFGLHISPILIPAGILGYFFDTAHVLLAMQALALSASAWPLAAIAERRFGAWAGVLTAFAFCLSPNLSHAATFEFHPGTIAVLPFAYALNALDKKDERAFGQSLLWVLACREDFALVTALIALISWKRMPEISKRLLKGSLIYFALFALILHPLLAPPQGSLALHFGKWGSSIGGVVLYCITHPLAVFQDLLADHRERALVNALAPFAFLPLLSPSLLIATAPILGVAVLSAFPRTGELDSHYLTPAIPILAAATLKGLEHVPKIARLFGFSAWIVATLFTSIAYGHFPFSKPFLWDDYVWDDLSRTRARVTARIPDRKSLQAPDSILPHVAERSRAFRSPLPDWGADIVVLDASHRIRFTADESVLRTKEEPIVRNWIARDKYGVVNYDAPYITLVRGASSRKTWEGVYLCNQQTCPVDATIFTSTEPQSLTRCLDVVDSRVTHNRIMIALIAHDACPFDLAIRLGPEKNPRRVDLLCDGLISPAHFRAGDKILSFHQMSPFEIEGIKDRGLFVTVLRSGGARPFHEDPVSVRVPLSIQ